MSYVTITIKKASISLLICKTIMVWLSTAVCGEERFSLERDTVSASTHLSGSRLTTRAIKDLVERANPETLFLGCPTTDAAIDFSALRSAHHLNKLTLFGLPPSKCLSAIQNCKEITTLRSVSIIGCSINSDILKELRKMESIKELKISGARAIDDSSLLSLKGMFIEDLLIAISPITDDSVKTFREMPFLKILRLEETSITSAGIQSLKNANIRVSVK